MPTMPKLVAGLCLAALAYVVSLMVMDVLPEGTDFGLFLPLNLLLGFLTGWLYVGPQKMVNMAEGLSYGLTGAGVMTFLALFLQSGNEMMRLAMRHRYDGALEAVAAVFQIGVEFGAEVLTMQVAVTLVIGGLVTGAIVYVAARRWS